MKLFIVFYLLFSLKVIYCGDILMIQLMPFSSYTNFMNAIINTLAPHHNITLYSAAHKEFNHENVTFHPIEKPYLDIPSFGNIFTQLKNNRLFALKNQIFGMNEKYMEELLKINRNLKDLVESRKKYDLFFSYTHISEHLIPLAHIVQAPLVLLSPSVGLPWHNDAIGTPNFFSYDYSLFNIASDSDCFSNRLTNYLTNFIITFLYYWSYLPKIDKSCQKMFPPDTPPLIDIYNNASLLILNTHEAMGHTRPALSNVIQVAGIHCNKPNKLPKDLEEFIEGSGEHGVIYFSFGTTIKAKVPKHVTDALLNVFKKLRQRILIKWNEDIEGLPKHIKVSKWFPQQDILGHKKTKLFISHGGMLSIQESLCHSVPVLIIPITFDQPSNAILVQKYGHGRFIYFNEISEERLEKEIHEILSNNKYRRNAKQISNLMKDEPLNPGDKLKWWVDFLIRHKGYPVRRPKDNRYSWIRFIETDILAFLILFFVLCMLFLICLCYSIVKMLTNALENGIKLKKI